MATFGNIKNKILVKLTESYGKENFKNDLNAYFKPIMKNNTLKEMYSLYEDVEKMTFNDKETAQLYVEELSKVLKHKNEEVGTLLTNINETLVGVEPTDNTIYESLDIISCPDTLGNISSKVVAKKNLVDHLTTDKTNNSLEVEKGVNESLLNSVLVNNFNLSFDKTLNEEDKTKLKSILSLDQKDVESKFLELTETINEKLDSLVESDKTFENKSKQVKTEMNEMVQSKYNLYRLEELLGNLE